MTPDASYFWFRLFRTRGIGPKALASLQRELERAGIAPEQIPTDKQSLIDQYPKLAKLILDKITASDRDALFSEYQELPNEGVTVIHPGHPEFPIRLLADAERFGVSPVLFVRGQAKLLSARGVAIVGSRDVSDQGARYTREIAAGLAERGLNVVSGYARGVDTEAHSGALSAEGTTTMVLSYGILEFKPKRSLRSLHFEHDAVAVSQLPPREHWTARGAMSRNKLVCALSDALLVIESGPERDSKGRMSGTFDAARASLNMGRHLFVLDPSALARPPIGNAQLLRLGAIPVAPTDGADLIASTLAASSESDGLVPHSEPVQTKLFGS